MSQAIALIVGLVAGSVLGAAAAVLRVDRPRAALASDYQRRVRVLGQLAVAHGATPAAVAAIVGDPADPAGPGGVDPDATAVLTTLQPGRRS